MEGKFFLSQYLICVILLLGQLHGCKSCIGKEREALLELKNYLMSRSRESGLDYVLPTWTNDTKSDCCQWEGIRCNRTIRRVIGLSVGNMYFKESSPLNLSLLHPFEEVRSLNLSTDGYNEFNGFFDDVEGYKSLSRLRSLQIIDLSTNYFNNSILPYLNAATSLTTLFLPYNEMDGPFPSKALKDLKNLELLDLRANTLRGSMQELTHLKKLRALDLSSNNFSSSMELQELKNMINLEVLSLAQNHLDGPLPTEVFCNMKNLRELDLRGNHFVGEIPLCLGSLNKLKVLDLSSNQFSGNLPSSFSSLHSLEYLSLSDNNFSSSFSLNPLTNLTKLKMFKLSSRSRTVQVKIESTWRPNFQLNVVVLRSCSLEKIPSFLAYQKNLRLVDLSSNKLSGNIPSWLLENNPELEVLQLQDNSFTTFQMPTTVHTLQVLDFSANNIGKFPDNMDHALPNLVRLNGSNNGFQGYFPSSIGEMVNISFLDLSYNNFYGKLPRNFVTGCVSLIFLKLSHNKFSGAVLPLETNFPSLDVLRMDNNLFTGKIGGGLLSSTFLRILDMSNNGLSGAIPRWLFEFHYLDFLLLSNNFLEGTIPPSLLGMPFLSFLDLSGNNLSGALPSRVDGVWGISMFLHNNSFSGSIPNTLVQSVQILDLRNNKLSGSIPQFVDTESINILLLKGNSLTGSIPRQLCYLRDIRLLDLSDNKLNGFIPSCLYNMSFGRLQEDTTALNIPPSFNQMSVELELYKSTFLVDKIEVDRSTYQEVEIKFAAKQRYDSYSGRSEFREGILRLMYAMDLSNNRLSGVIPTEIGDLLRLRVLNISHNFLSSSIPSSFSKLKDIESLDLSHNKLQGSIPQQLSSLTSLAVFDVSYNNLSGIIPQGRQFNTFDENSYIGNPLLCGLPTNRSCEAKKDSEEAMNEREEEEDEAAIDMLVFSFSTASTYVAALIGILALMCFDCPWNRAWLCIVDGFIAYAKNIFH
ncbi:probable LRR receptor-like serine/threonine-protein kinase At4g36180 isoform X1 [Capsella rubella]|uniref:probable LRR receptor-like serine/threonine-protein kinase At4g36180 isoform X1 n=1 Tax=Capsella rubella TaxID=81985 RepID=UPI000CD4BFBC|nr:probable LRR receptor-like serine/threonine-protein kinase At4g36180 isoform X1 [Capsella rubella]